jgi:metal transporter CNNM
MSGLTVGYLSIDEWNMQINLNKDYSDSQSIEKKKYQEIADVLKDRHWLLVTLLLCNATAMEALPIFLSNLHIKKLN